MKIVFIITGLSTGGAEMMLLRLLQHIDLKQFNPHVISLKGKEKIGMRIESYGIQVNALHMSSKRLHIGKIFQLIKLLRRIKPDIVQTWMYHADLLGGLATRISGIKNLVWAIHNNTLPISRGTLLTILIRKTCAILSHVIPKKILVCSEHACHLHVKIGYDARKMLIIPNGFDASLFKPDVNRRSHIRKELGVSDEVLLIGIVGRWDPQKNILGFLYHAVPRIINANPAVRFVIAGFGLTEHNQILKKTITGLEKSVCLLGMRNDIPAIMSSLDVFVLPSHSEAFPIVLGEAMASGLPCVATNAGDSSIIMGNTGKVVERGDMESLAESVLQYLSLDQKALRKLGERARTRIVKYYSIDNIVHRYENLYMKLLDNDTQICAG